MAHKANDKTWEPPIETKPTLDDCKVTEDVDESVSEDPNSWPDDTQSPTDDTCKSINGWWMAEGETT